MDLQGDLIIALVSIVAVTLFGGSSAGTRYAVGDAVWSIPPYPDYYTNWSSSQVFYIGDSLLFDFETELYNVIQVPKLDYDSCTSNNPIKILNSGPAIILLNEEGVFYYICNMSNYCALGQKISVVVHKHPTSLPPSPSPSLSPSPSPSLVPFIPSLLPPSRSPEPSSSEWNRSQSPVLLPYRNGNSKAVATLGDTWCLNYSAFALYLVVCFVFG